MAARTVIDRYFAEMPWAYPIALGAVALGLAFGAGVAQEVAAERRRHAIDGFAAEHGWTRADAPAWVRRSSTGPLAPSAKPEASNVWEGTYRGWPGWSLEIEAQFGWKGAKAPVGYHLLGLGVAGLAHRVELARRGSVYARAYREGDLRAESALKSVGWIGLDKDAEALAGIHESWALARVLGTAEGVDHVVVDGGAIWTSRGADADRRVGIHGELDTLIAVAHALSLQPSPQ